ncbi:hypothetical protein C5167_028736 [Papaver somniferum]|nr:hypothetical protein C5167_028736 [Papaver somniferum]
MISESRRPFFEGINTMSRTTMKSYNETTMNNETPPSSCDLFSGKWEYNATIEFYWAPLMLESNSYNPEDHRTPHRIVKAGSIEKHAIHWTDADILVFDSFIWWRVTNLDVLWGSFEKPNEGIYNKIGMEGNFEMAMKTWSDWLENHINRTMTQLISELKVKGVDVQILNITQLSEYRKDAHPSMYKRLWVPLTPEQISNPTSYSDCMHWCLPGVPDTWNELLYAYII